MREDVDGRVRDKTRPSHVPPLPPETVERVAALTPNLPLGGLTHCTVAAIAKVRSASARCHA